MLHFSTTPDSSGLLLLLVEETTEPPSTLHSGHGGAHPPLHLDSMTVDLGTVPFHRRHITYASVSSPPSWRWRRRARVTGHRGAAPPGCKARRAPAPVLGPPRVVDIGLYIGSTAAALTMPPSALRAPLNNCCIPAP
jgi:hypothetical protein